MELLAEFVVFGHPPRKSNSRRIVQRGQAGSPMLIKSQAALDYETDFLKQVPGEYRDRLWGSLDDHLHLEAVVYYRDFKSDLSVELVKDVMEKAGIVKDDRYIRSEHLSAFIDKHNPRIEIRLYQLPKDRTPPFHIIQI